MVSAKKKSQSFNWKGINDNGDGTFTTKGKIEKRRLLKEFHSQGVAVRSKRNNDGSWTVTPVGNVRPKGQSRRRTSSAGYRPKASSQGYRPQTRALGPPPEERYVAYGSLRQPRAAPSYGPRPYAGGYGGGGARPSFHIPKFAREKAQKKVQSEIDIGKVKREEAQKRSRGGYEDEETRQRMIRETGSAPASISHETRVKESLEAERGMRERSAGQPSTRIPTRWEREDYHEEQQDIRIAARDRKVAAGAQRANAPRETAQSQNVKLNGKPVDLSAARDQALRTEE